MPSSPSIEASRLVRGARIAGRLELLHVIGAGGMASVWAARNTATDGKVALKILSPDRGANPQAVARFRYEARLGATLNHRNITRVLDLVETDDGALVLVMELLRGETLDAYYRRKGHVSTREAVAVVVPLLSALQHAHEQGIVHRDLKPSNIFLHTDADGQVTPKLLDFGIAKVERSEIETRTGDAIGTPQFMSPEQVRAAGLDGRSDLFSIAVVLYEVITGQNPFPGPTPTAMLAQVLEMEIDPDPAIDPRVWIELRRALSKHAYQRHASAKELATALCAAVGESEIALASSLRAEAPALSNPPGPLGARPRFASEPEVLVFPDPAAVPALPTSPSMDAGAAPTTGAAAAVEEPPAKAPPSPRATRRVVVAVALAGAAAIGVAALVAGNPKPGAAAGATPTTSATPSAVAVEPTTPASAAIASAPPSAATTTVELDRPEPSASSEPAQASPPTTKRARPAARPHATSGTRTKPAPSNTVGRTPGF